MSAPRGLSAVNNVYGLVSQASYPGEEVGTPAGGGAEWARGRGFLLGLAPSCPQTWLPGRDDLLDVNHMFPGRGAVVPGGEAQVYEEMN